jgi:hypothetical protein
MYYWIFSIVTILVFFIFGTFMVLKNEKGEYVYPYTRFALLPALVYAVLFGVRWEWAKDYHHYRDVYEMGDILLHTFEPLYQVIINTMHLLELPFWFSFIFYAFIFMWGYMMVMRDHREVIWLTLPLLYCYTPGMVGNLVRFYTAVGFIYMAIPYITRNQWIQASILMAAGFFIHYAMILVIPFFLVLWWVNPFRWKWINIGTLLISALLTPKRLGWIIYGILRGVDMTVGRLEPRLATYLQPDVLKHFFVYGKTNDFGYSKLSLACYLIMALASIWYGYRLVEENSENRPLSYLYRLCVLGFILFIPCIGLELMVRVYAPFGLLSIIFVGYTLHNMWRREGFAPNWVTFIVSVASIFLLTTPLRSQGDVYDLLYIWER